MKYPFTLTYKHNGIKPAGAKWDYDCKYAHETFSTARDAQRWIENHKQYTPCKLLEWDSKYHMFFTLIDFMKGEKI